MSSVTSASYDAVPDAGADTSGNSNVSAMDVSSVDSDFGHASRDLDTSVGAPEEKPESSFIANSAPAPPRPPGPPAPVPTVWELLQPSLNELNNKLDVSQTLKNLRTAVRDLHVQLEESRSSSSLLEAESKSTKDALFSAQNALETSLSANLALQKELAQKWTAADRVVELERQVEECRAQVAAAQADAEDVAVIASAKQAAAAGMMEKAEMQVASAQEHVKAAQQERDAAVDRAAGFMAKMEEMKTAQEHELRTVRLEYQEKLISLSSGRGAVVNASSSSSSSSSSFLGAPGSGRIDGVTGGGGSVGRAELEIYRKKMMTMTAEKNAEIARLKAALNARGSGRL